MWQPDDQLFAASLLAAAPGFWFRYLLVIGIGAAALVITRSSIVTCTVLALWVAGLIASFYQNEEIAMLVLVMGLTAGPILGVLVDGLMTRERRVLSLINRKYARPYDCPVCGHQYSTVQSIPRCPRCEHRLSGGA